MVDEKILRRLFKAFPYALINRNLEFVANPNPKVNSYFILSGTKTEREIQRKLLEFLSREASSSMHYKLPAYNYQVHKYHRDGINDFLGTNFTHDDMEIIYQKLGNGANRELTIKFIQSGFDMKILNAEN